MSRYRIFVLFFGIALALATCTTQINFLGTPPISKESAPSSNTSIKSGKELVGVYFMPSWNTSGNPKIDKDSFWSCLSGRDDCAFLKDTGAWGPKGRIYNSRYPYEGPFLERKPISELKGFYKRDDPEVAKKQLQYMKQYGIDFFAYNWFYGRHYYYHRYFGPQSKIYYPEGWRIDGNRDGRVAVPGLPEWDEQLNVLLNENSKLPEKEQMKWAINWCDDSHERWMHWLAIGSPDELARKANYPGESPNKELYLQVHEKITRHWTDNYFKRKDYLKDSLGRPIVYFYFPQDTESRAAFYGISMKSLLDLSQKIAKQQGLPGIKFIAVTAGPMLERERMYGLPTLWQANNPKRPWEGGQYKNRLLLQEYVPRLKGMGFEGMTGYVYHNFFEQYNHSYADMRKTYRGHWEKWSEQFKGDPDFEYQVPVAMGWDMRPMGGTWPQASGFPSEPSKDQVHSTKETFKANLKDARQVSQKYRSTNGNTVMICCWNEYLEGNYIEPTQGHRFNYLEAIWEVFGENQP
ncbi:glycoside hydrolase family 99-like domain-containing protein [Algoriphagus sp. CAU 1675]|uniref:glycoside hydrolase family 99-like domain-containing protein n=1 Tax=Algoriphagus sp. CAU 1675 TaxID=3032597 RepID=UPI0023DC4560|nr:glycoside hydrolase family 99-like domain-containing protein [Algoriphagus sp. CAU 1675]MDF2159354.1 glycoside hydrolase family 99-like domain-containing protein [Algoriphagus sp. CAU 1675]